MGDSFYFSDFTEETIQKQKFLCLYVLDFEKHVVFRIFKKHSDDLYDRCYDIQRFEDITDRIAFAIKRDGKISLDIKI